MLFDETHGDDCDNPNCPIHGANSPVKEMLEKLKKEGFSVKTGKGIGNLVEALTAVGDGNPLAEILEEAKKKERVRKEYVTAIKTVIRVTEFEGIDEDQMSQALMEALCHILGSAMAKYSFDYLQDQGIEGPEWNDHFREVAKLWESMLLETVRNTVGSLLRARSIHNAAIDYNSAKAAEAEQAGNN